MLTKRTCPDEDQHLARAAALLVQLFRGPAGELGHGFLEIELQGHRLDKTAGTGNFLLGCGLISESDAGGFLQFPHGALQDHGPARLTAAATAPALKGQEAKRLQGTDDKRLLERAYTYIDEGNGVKPEPGVGSLAHEVKLPKLYDARVNSDKLWNAGDLNATESAILDAGYHGYYVSPGKDGSQQGTAVVLGQASRNLQTRPLADWKKGASSAPGAAAQSAQESRGLMFKELSSIDAANIPGAKLKNGTLTVPLESRDAANDEMARIGSNVRFSNARDITATPAFESWYGAWQNAAGGQDEKATHPGGTAARPAADGRGLDVGGGRDVDAVQQRARLDQNPAPATTVGQAHFSGTSGPLGKDGSSLVVYHGTRDDIESFDLAHPNRKDVGWLGRGIYTRSSADQAGDYAEVKRGTGGERIMPLYPTVKNPYVISNMQKARMKGASQAQIDLVTQSLKDMARDFQFLRMMQIHLRGWLSGDSLNHDDAHLSNSANFPTCRMFTATRSDRSAVACYAVQNEVPVATQWLH